MSKLSLSVAVGPYDRTRALIDGSVQIDGVEPTCMTLPPEEIFFRALRHAEFDICELSLSSFTVKTAQGGGPYVGVPAFVSRMFRHTSIWVRTDRIKKPEDLKGKRVGLPEYQLTANVWARAVLEEDYGVKPSDIHWIRGGIEDSDRPEKITISVPKDVRLDNAPAGKSISRLLADGEIDGFIAPRPPSLPRNTPNVGWLFPDPAATASDYFKRTGIFPIMHVVGIKEEIVERHPWVAINMYKAFEQAKALAMARMENPRIVPLAWYRESWEEQERILGKDPWEYGLTERNINNFERLVTYSLEQGLSSRRLSLDELFLNVSEGRNRNEFRF